MHFFLKSTSPATFAIMVLKAPERDEVFLPVAHQGAQGHQAVLHAGNDFRGAVSSQEELPAGFKAAERERSAVPLVNHLLQFLLNVSLFHGANTDVLLKQKDLVLSRESPTSRLNSLGSSLFDSHVSINIRISSSK